MIATIFQLTCYLLSRAFFLNIAVSDIQDFILKMREGDDTSLPMSRDSTGISLVDSPQENDVLQEDQLEDLLSKSVKKIPMPMNIIHARFLTAHPLITSSYATKIMLACSTCLNTIQAVNMGSETQLLSKLVQGFDELKSRLVDTVCDGVLLSKSFSELSYMDNIFFSNRILS